MAAADSANVLICQRLTNNNKNKILKKYSEKYKLIGYFGGLYKVSD